NTAVMRITQLVPRQNPQNFGPRFRKDSIMAGQTQGKGSHSVDRKHTWEGHPRQPLDLVSSATWRWMSH
ncbi:MAG: hypothetical protein V3R58_01495, partial [candidate division NC10 bacterium]